MFAFLAEHRARVFPASTGRPSLPGEVAASVLVLQALHDLSERDAVDAIRCDIRWKVACGLPLDHEGFHPTVLTYWRRRPAASDRPDRILGAVRAVISQTGVLAGKSPALTFARPIRKVYYSITITGLSVFVAVFIGTIELLGLLSQEAGLSGGFWDFTANFNINTAGFVIVGAFVLTWAIALSGWHFGRIERR